MSKIVNFHYSFWRFSELFHLSDTSVGGLARLSTHPAEFGSDASSRYWLKGEAERGRIEATMALVRSPRSAEDKLRWLIVAADGVKPPKASSRNQCFRRTGRTG